MTSSLIVFLSAGGVEPALDYWEEVLGEDGTAWFYNHTIQEYSAILPGHMFVDSPGGDCALNVGSNKDVSNDDSGGNALLTGHHVAGDELLHQDTDGNSQGILAAWEVLQGGEDGGGIWGEHGDGGISVPWLVKELGDMKTSPDSTIVRGALPELPDGEV